ncbi:MAG: LSU ribosomal protein L15p (L27Ae) [uncultured Gemmatimonadetes bacterium]|uniref:Large ribosomal subunit protein uL15 n=1 Tax=uncultured Gemmatimonadota bacterium TaxID=203437 RepID=A0A6J4KHC8_9BACT|nr:MAG: LSU ribosomal protein L15p (L27Ae) [uncultured Gemmatimonadota bacterium]
MADLSNLRRPEGSHRDTKRLGRGVGSGTGKTAGKGHKGSKARAGHHGPGGGKPGYEGGQMPIHRQQPKRGFTNPNRVEYQVVNLYQLETLEGEGPITPETLKDRGLIGHAGRPVKVLGTGDLTRKVEITAHKFSQSARDKIAALGGTVQEIG